MAIRDMQTRIQAVQGQESLKIQEIVPKELYDTKLIHFTGTLAGVTIPTPVVTFYDNPSAGDLLTNIKQSRQLSNEHFFVRDIQLKAEVQSFNITAELPAAPADQHYFLPPSGTMFNTKQLIGHHPAHTTAFHELCSDVSQAIFDTSVFEASVNQTDYLQTPAYRLTPPVLEGPFVHSPGKSQEGGLILMEDLYFKPNDSFNLRVELNQVLLSGSIYLAFLSWIMNGLAIGLSDGGAPPSVIYNPDAPLSILNQCDFQMGVNFSLVARGVVARTIR